MRRTPAAIEGPGRVVVRTRVGSGRPGRSRSILCRLDCLGRARIWLLLRRRAQGERWLALLRLGADLASGVPPESLPADYIAKAIAMRETFAGRSERSCDRILGGVSSAPGRASRSPARDVPQAFELCCRATREALMSDAAVFQARRRKCPDLAEQWLAGIPATSPQSWLRLRAEAAVLEARGDIEGSLRMLDAYETAIGALPNATQREVLSRGLSPLAIRITGMPAIT